MTLTHVFLILPLLVLMMLVGVLYHQRKLDKERRARSDALNKEFRDGLDKIDHIIDQSFKEHDDDNCHL